MISTLGRYKIVAEIGQGAMGVVYKAVDPIIDRTVAIKTINLNLSRQELEEYEARFQQEIKAAGRLNHPNIVTIYDVGKTDQVAYMAMEFLEGNELKDIIASGTLLPPDQVGKAVVRFEKLVKRVNADQAEPPQTFVATMAFEFRPSMRGREKDLIENPLGFKVTAYRVDAEIGSQGGV